MTRSPRSEDDGRPSEIAGFDDQMWPINCAIVVLAGFVAGIVLANSDFHDGRLLYDGRLHLGIVGGLVVLTLVVARLLQGKIRRRLQLCILLSLLVHLSGAYCVYCNPVTLSIVADRGGDRRDLPPDEDFVAPDYHWVQAEEPDADQAFESPVETVVRDEMPPAATVAPPGPEQAMPVADIPRAPGVGETPLGSFGPGSQVAMPMAPVVASRQLQPVAGPAMNRQAVRAVEIPSPEGEVAELPAAAPKESPRGPEAATLAAVRTAPSTGVASQVAGLARSSAAARPLAEPSQAVPANSPLLQLPSAVLVRTHASPNGGGQGTEFASRPSTRVRADIGGQGLPSSVLPGDSEPSVAPAAAGNSAGSRIEATSGTAVERALKSRAPAGPAVAAAGTQDFGIGAGLLVARSGIAGGDGTSRPTIAGLGGEEEGPLRAGAPSSFSDRGAPLRVAAARRRGASQPSGGGTALAPGVAATLPRTHAAGGSELPSAVLPSEEVNVAGAGGVSATPGGGTSNLEAGPVASVRRSTAAGAPHAPVTAPAGAFDFGAGSSPAALPAGLVPAGPRGTFSPNAWGPSDLGRPKAEDSATGGVFARAAATPSLPGNAVSLALAPPPASPAAPRQGSRQLDAGRGLTEVAMANTPLADVRGIGRRSPAPTTTGKEGPGDAVGTSGTVSPQPPIARGRGRSDIDPNDLGSGIGPTAVARSGGPLVLEGSVKEPTEFYRRRGEIRHGLGLEDAEGAGFTEPAVEIGLGFFTRIQFPDGHWSLDRLPEGVRLDDAALGEMQADTAATGLVLLSYLGAGYTHLDEKYRDVVRRGVEWLVKHQKPDGDLFAGGSRFTHFYSHGIAAMALSEVYGMTQDPELREPARKAIAFIVKTQDPRRGGWRYEPGEESDTSVTGWQLMALRSAQMAGLDVPQETLGKIGGWLDRAAGPESDGRYVYNPWNSDTPEQREGRLPSLAMTAEAMLMRMYLGQRRDKLPLVRGAEFLAAHLPEVGSRQQPTRDCYYWYYATQAMYQMQGPYWTAWHNRINPLLKAGQAREGPLAGSWHPTEPVPDRWGAAGGRLYVTAMHLLMLEVYYRHLPLFQELSK